MSATDFNRRGAEAQRMERPILFSGAMVRAILADEKDRTRRVCKHQYWSYSELHDVNKEGFVQKVDRAVSCPYGRVGDRLWVRETWRVGSSFDEIAPSNLGTDCIVGYKADEPTKVPHPPLPAGRWRPSIHMPRWASRITLEITGIRVERLQEITAKDAIAEGIPRSIGTGLIASETVYHMTTNSGYMRGSQGAIVAFRDLWDSINAKRGYGWEKNPWVWALKFRKL